MRRLKPVFDSIYDQYKDRNGQKFEIIGMVDSPDDEHDEEVLPMFVIRFRDLTEIEVWPEEIFEKETRT